MPEQYAYSTDNPETVAEYRQVRQARTEYAERLRSDCDALGGNSGALFRGGMFGQPDALVALDPDGSGTIPAGWRLVRGRLEPRRGAPGDPARSWIAEHQPPDIRCAMVPHGLPRHSVIAAEQNGFTHRHITPVLFEHDGTLWACYEGYPAYPDSLLVAKDGAGCTWTPRKLSEFYAAREAVMAAEAVASDA
jgi:hypothetical protein